MAKEKTIIDKIAWIYIKDSKILSTLSKGKDTWYIPGGKRETGENDIETLVREVKEELNVEHRMDTIRYIGTYSAQAHGKAAGVMVKMTCYASEYIGELTPSSEVGKFAWLTYADRYNVSPVDQIIMDDLLRKGLIK